MDQEERLKAALADRYQIECEIGSGGMATVYLAQDLKHDRKVAVKVLDPDLAQTLGAERFLREIKTAANLTHPHILPLHDSGEADGFLFYVMPYVKGESLRTRLTKEKQLPVEDAIKITREIADALAYAHAEGVIHRDVKPANIMLEAGHAVLADFGVAHAVAEAREDRITRTGTSLGTPAYMSPEQATGKQDLDGRSDQYALGCVLYEMLAGHPPFTGAQVEAVVRQHITEEPPSVTQARPSVAEEVAKVINRALAKSPADRFRTTGEMAAALAMTTSPVTTRTPPSRAKSVAFAALSILVLAVLAVVVSQWGPAGTGQSGSQPGSSEVETTAEILNRLPGLAVLPFANRSSDPNDQYFADGIQDDLITSLQRASGLRVVSRTSSDTYRNTDKTVQQIGQELGVDYILEGAVQRAGDRVRINVQLIDAPEDRHLRAYTYDRVLRPDSLFELQSEIVSRVYGETGVALVAGEWMWAARQTTRDQEAFDLFARAKAVEFTQEAVTLLAEAVERDPEFVAAYATLANYQAYLYQYYGLRSEERRAAAKAAAEKAVELAPDSPDAQLAMGRYLYRVEQDYEGALDWLGRASGTLRGDLDYHLYRAFAERRMGRWQESLESLKAAVALSPRRLSTWNDLASSNFRLRRYEEADRAVRELLRLDPDFETARGANIVWGRDGSLDGWHAFLRDHPSPWPSWWLAMTEGRHDDALAVLESLPDTLVSQLFWYPASLMRGMTLSALGQDATGAFGEAAALLEGRVLETDWDQRAHAALGLAYAGLGRRDDAVAEARRAVDLLPLERDAMDAPWFLLNLAAVHAHFGEVDESLDLLETVLSVPSLYPPGIVQDHYLLIPLRDEPRFQELIEREWDRVF